MLSFTKMNGAGNDFVLLDNRAGTVQLGRPEIARLCNRHRGIGADGVLILEPAQNGADFRMRYYNSDGGEAEMCGNGARCFARFASRLAGPRDAITFETMAGVIGARFVGEQVELQMSPPRELAMRVKLSVGSAPLVVHSLNTGVPHAVVPVATVKTVDVPSLGAALRDHEQFAPKGTNVNFSETVDARTIRIRTYERGVEGETEACGTGVVASALIHHELTGAESPIGVWVRGDDRLEVGFAKTENGYEHVTLTGPAEFVFEGQVIL